MGVGFGIFLKGYSDIFFFGLLIRTLKVTIISVVNFLITCIVFEILKDKDTSQPPY